MAETSATILIPDISGFTEFVSTTELAHSTKAINMLIDAMVEAVGEAFEVSEIEGDAVLLIKKDPPPSKKEILDTCLKIFNAFHFRRQWMQQYTICPCGACQAISNLTLKFVVHHGPLAEIKVGRFVKHSGTDMIVAHRLLKNNIDNNEYLLLTERFLEQAADTPGEVEMEWVSSADDYASIGRIAYRFSLLREARRNAPGPPQPPSHYRTDDTAYLETPIAANFLDAYMAVMNIPGRPGWLADLQKVEQEIPEVFVGSLHRCIYNDFEALVSPLRMMVSPEEILYAESWRMAVPEVFLVQEFVFRKEGEKACTFACRFMNAGEAPVPEETRTLVSESMHQMARQLKAYCEQHQEAG
jgi:Protein of unknown function (DUF2652)